MDGRRAALRAAEAGGGGLSGDRTVTAEEKCERCSGAGGGSRDLGPPSACPFICLPLQPQRAANRFKLKKKKKKAGSMPKGVGPGATPRGAGAQGSQLSPCHQAQVTDESGGKPGPSPAVRRKGTPLPRAQGCRRHLCPRPPSCPLLERTGAWGQVTDSTRLVQPTAQEGFGCN